MYGSIWFSRVASHSGYKISPHNSYCATFYCWCGHESPACDATLGKFEVFVLMHFNYLNVVYVSLILSLSHKSATLVASGWDIGEGGLRTIVIWLTLPNAWQHSQVHPVFLFCVWFAINCLFQLCILISCVFCQINRCERASYRYTTSEYSSKASHTKMRSMWKGFI